MRGLKAKDIFPMSRLLTKMNIKEELKELLSSNANENKKIGGVNTGIDVVMLVIENIEYAEQEFYELISSVSESNAESVKEMPLGELIQILMQIFSDADFASFFKSAAK